LQQGGIAAIISQRPEEQGRQALLTLYRHIVLEQDIRPRVEIPLDVYLKENIPAEWKNSNHKEHVRFGD
jgi:LacI family transcriptional regulator